MSLFTCISCQVAFSTPELQKQHMKSDWHRYNLKRKVVDLPPLNQVQFAAKVTEAQTVPVEQSRYECVPCGKVYSSKNGFQNHQSSKKHLLKLAQPVQKAGQQAEDKAEEKPEHKEKIDWKRKLQAATSEAEVDRILDEKLAVSERLSDCDCLFCSHSAESMEENLKHMHLHHSFFIPDMDYIIDIKGLLQYLADKITVANLCLFCNGKGRALHSTEALDKSHCKMAYEDGDTDDYADYYEFQEIWEDVESVSGEEGEEFETQSVFTDAVSRGASRIHLNDTGTELILPSGTKLGHRQFRTYWNQNIKTREIVPGSRDDPEMISRLKMIGAKEFNHYSQAVILKRQEMRITNKSTKIELQRRNDFRARVGQKHNMLQHHYREQNPF